MLCCWRYSVVKFLHLTPHQLGLEVLACVQGAMAP
jgi:hypothetical protein